MPDVSRHGLINPSPVQPDLSAPATPAAPAAEADTDAAAIAPSIPLPAPEVLPITEPAVTYFVQTGAFQKQTEADNQRARLALTGVDATILSPEVGAKPLYRVRVGPIVSVDEVRTLVATLKNNGISTNIITVDNTKTKPH
jgi:cell division protein FtsN